jgi:predicted small lipoprotein YifL
MDIHILMEVFMKKYLTLFFALIMGLSLCSCGQKNPELISEASDTPASKTETEASSVETDTDTASQDKQGGAVTIEIAPPDGWVPMEGSVAPVHYMKGTASFIVKEEPFNSSNLDDVVNEAIGIYQKSFENFKADGEAEPLTVDEKDARKLTFTCTISKINMKFLYVYLFAADKTYVITFGDQKSTFDALSADYETILSNIKFNAQ